MKITVPQIAFLLDDITKDVSDPDVLSSRLRDFVQLASRYDLLYRADVIFHEYARVVRRRLGLKHIRIYSATTLPEAQQRQLRLLFPNESDIEFLLDPTLKYGIRMMIDDTVLDSSLAGRLWRLERSFQQ